MPSLSNYSSYETLVFFQNVVRHGADTTALQEISTTLNQNQLIRESNSYQPAKFEPDALLYLYNCVIQGQRNATAKTTNGDTRQTDANVNPKKRKLSTSPPPAAQPRDDQVSLQDVVEKLYASFKQEVVREIREQERQYGNLQQEIKHLEEQVRNEPKKPVNGRSQASTPAAVALSKPSIDTNAEPQDPAAAQLQATLNASREDTKSPAVSVQSQSQAQPTKPPHLQPAPERAHASPAPTPRSVTPRSSAGTPHQRPASLQPQSSHPPQVQQPPQQTPAHPSPGTYNRSLPPPSPSRSSHTPVPLPQQHGYPPPPVQQYPTHPQHMMHHGPPLQQMQPHIQGRASPVPYQGPPYPHHPQYPQGPPPQQWHPQGPQQYGPPPQYGAPPYYPQGPPPGPQGRPPHPMHTPQQQQPPYPPYPHTAPIPYGTPQWRGAPPGPYSQYPASATTTPVPRPRSRLSLPQSASSTPWKRQSMPPNMRTRSPTRNERDVSPISDRGSPPPKAKSAQPQRTEKTPKTRKSREQSSTPAPSAVRRSQSIVSTTSEARTDKVAAKPPHIKAEPPATPASLASDTEQKSSGRKGRPRANTSTARPDLSRTTTATATKRKRESIASRSPTPSAAPAPTSSSTFAASRQHDSSLIVVSRNFAKTCQLLLNEITSHKLAGIFAKPLSERDAPGYKDLVRRPQDLKSIKTAVSKGSRAANAAIEELEANLNANPDTNELTTAGEGPIGNGFFLIASNEDLLPPKGIVNSTQLETELVRMFANAIMFNPLPPSARGFGPNLRLRKRGGAPRTRAQTAARRAAKAKSEDDEDEDSGENGENGSSTTEGEEDDEEGGIIQDAREMLEDITLTVARWREVEEERMYTDVGHKEEGARQRSGSVDSAADVAEEEKGDETPVGGARKRRKVGEH